MPATMNGNAACVNKTNSTIPITPSLAFGNAEKG